MRLIQCWCCSRSYEQADEFSYWNFFLDWGPLSLGNLFRFCRTLNFKLKSERLVGKVIMNLHKIHNVMLSTLSTIECPSPLHVSCKIAHEIHTRLPVRGQAIYVYSGSHAHKRTNAAFLLSAWLMLYGGRTPEQVRLVFPSAACWWWWCAKPAEQPPQDLLKTSKVQFTPASRQALCQGSVWPDLLVYTPLRSNSCPTSTSPFVRNVSCPVTGLCTVSGRVPAIPAVP